MVRWKKIIGIISIIYVGGLLIFGCLSMIQLGPGEIYSYDLNGRTHPDIHYHTIYPVWFDLWFKISLFSLPVLLIFYFFDPFGLKEMED